jgi:hypothetical protein
LTPTGLERTPNSAKKSAVIEIGGAKSGAPSADSNAIDPDLARIVAAWPTLAEPIKRAMLALIG